MSKYCHSNDGELYYGEFDTEQDALEDAKESYPGESEIYIGTVQSRYLDGIVARKKLLIPLKKIWLKMWVKQQKILEFLKNRNRNLRG